MDNLTPIVESIVREILNAQGGKSAPKQVPCVPCKGGDPSSNPGSSEVLPEEPSGDVLALITAGASRVEHLVSDFQRLRASGRTLGAYLSDSAEDAIGRELVKDRLGIDHFIETVPAGRETDLLRRWSVVVLPTCNRNVVAKMANAIHEGFAVRMAYAALAAHLPVIAVRDGLEAKTADGIDPALTLPGMNRIIDEQMRVVAGFGMRFVPSNRFADEVEIALRGGMTVSTPARVITVDDVRDFRGKTLFIQPGAIVTAAARDMLAERGIEIKTR